MDKSALGPSVMNQARHQGPHQQRQQFPGGQTTAGTIDLRRIWEEEKLARDVYLQLGKSTGLPIFDNIARSENQHMMTIQRLIGPGGRNAGQPTDIPGTFSFADYQQLYETLIAEGSRSIEEALAVGIRIEEMDIVDLQRMLPMIDDPRTRQTMERLMKGSQNHLRAFSGQLTSNGGSYNPRYLSQSDYDSLTKKGATGGQFGNQNGATQMKRYQGSQALQNGQSNGVAPGRGRAGASRGGGAGAGRRGGLNSGRRNR